jgi:hypothetical protein
LDFHRDLILMVDFWVGRIGDLHLEDSFMSFELYASSTHWIAIGNHCVFPCVQIARPGVRWVFGAAAPVGMRGLMGGIDDW